MFVAALEPSDYVVTLEELTNDGGSVPKTRYPAMFQFPVERNSAIVRRGVAISHRCLATHLSL